MKTDNKNTSIREIVRETLYALATLALVTSFCLITLHGWSAGA